MYKLGDIVYGKVTNIVGYGAFVNIDDEYTGLIHISEFSDNYVKNINDYVKLGDKVKLKIIEIEDDYKRFKLSYKLVNKVRGVKGDIPKYSIGFKSLRDRMPQFIKEQEKNHQDN